MDPNATLLAIIEAATEGRPTELQRAADALAAWLRRGGFPPSADDTLESLKRYINARNRERVR